MNFIEAYSWINIKFLLSGLLVTLQVAVTAGIFSFIFGIILGVLSYLKLPVISRLCRIWVEIFRNLPLLVLIFFAYFALPQIGIRLDVFWASVVALVIFESSMVSEVVRGGLVAIPAGQLEAAQATGLSKFQALWYIVLPQALKMMLPALISQAISLVKDTSLAVIITLPELTRRARIIYGLNTSYVIPMFAMMAFIYFVICYGLSLVSKQAEKKVYVE